MAASGQPRPPWGRSRPKIISCMLFEKSHFPIPNAMVWHAATRIIVFSWHGKEGSLIGTTQFSDAFVDYCSRVAVLDSHATLAEENKVEKCRQVSVHGSALISPVCARLRFSAPTTPCTRARFCERVATRCSCGAGGGGRMRRFRMQGSKRRPRGTGRASAGVVEASLEEVYH